MPIIEARDLWFAYTSNNYVLKGASLKAVGGRVTAIVGPTGCGKTTLLLILAGLLKPEHGMVLVDGTDLWSLLPQIRRRIGVLFQNPDDQLFNPTIYDELAYSLRTMGVDEGSIRNIVIDIARRLGIADLLTRPPYRLSMGQKRLVALASILVYDPDILLLDEPTTFLDNRGVSVLDNLILELKRMGKAIIVATHNIEMVLRHADEVYVLRNGITHRYDIIRFIKEGLMNSGIYIPRSLRRLMEACNGDPVKILRLLRDFKP